MNDPRLLWPILLPLLAGLAVLPVRSNAARAREIMAVMVSLALVVLAGLMFREVGPGGEVSQLTYIAGWAGFGIDFSLRLYQFSAFILLAAAGFSLLVSLYCWKAMEGRPHLNQFYAYMLISVGMVNGAVLANHLVVLLFFWEGLLGTLFGMIAIGRPGAYKTAVKAFIIVGVTDVCLMIGIALTGWKAGTLVMSDIAAQHLDLAGAGSGTLALAMILMMIGAVSKAGSMPFHSWIPDAAVDAPLPFMAILPASLEKLLGIYFLSRITLDLFKLSPESWISPLLMTLGALTILLAVAMALVQKDYKRLLSYHAISQVGYMVLGVGTALPIGIVGGVFHMINHAMYKSCLFLTGGAVERQAGTTDLAKLGGLARNMPITFICFVIAAASISGFPLTNGFYSKELVYEGALERGWIFYAAAVLGTVLTAASFLKLGHAAYLGRRALANENVKEAPLAMQLPMIVIAAGCLLFGLYNALPLQNLVEPSLKVSDHSFAGFLPHNWLLAGLTCVAIGIAFINHLVGVKKSGSGLGAVDHIHHAPVLGGIYAKAERRWFDPYDIGYLLLRAVSLTGFVIDRIIDAIYDGLIVGLTSLFSKGVRALQSGNYSLYVLWALAGAAAVVGFLMAK